MTHIAEGVSIHVSGFMQSNSVIVDGPSGVLLIDAGVTADELAALAADLRERGVAAGFSTHPHWDHLLWHPDLGAAPRYGTATAAAVITSRLADENWPQMVAGMIPEDLVSSVPLDDVFGRISGLPAGETLVPWDGPEVRVIEHGAHAPGHAALLLTERGVLVAGDMVSDILVPILNFFAADPVADYLAALDLLEASGATVFVPGHGTTGNADELSARIALDRAYLHALREGRLPDDPRLRPSAPYGIEMTGITQRQLDHLAPAPPVVE